MDRAQKLGIMIFSGVPAIMGGGIVYSLLGGAIPVVVYEVLLMGSLAVFIKKQG